MTIADTDDNQAVPQPVGATPDAVSPDAVAPDAADTPVDLAVAASSVYRTFEQDTAPVRALRGADLTLRRGEFVAVMGPSGCGKSTLLNLVAGLDVPDEGEIAVAGRSIVGMDENQLAVMRRKHIGIVFQFFNLLEGMTVLENVVMPAVIAGQKRRAAGPRARDLLDLLGLGDKARQAPGVLSGGQRQRLAIARALANEPTVVLADEPTGALDSEGGAEVLELFRRLHAGGQTILMVTHDQPVADAAERIVRMKDGRVVDDGAAWTRLPMGLYRLWLRGEWRRRWPSLLGLAAIVAVAGGAVLVAVSGARRADSAFDRFYRSVAAPTLLAQSVGAEGGGLPRFEGVLDELDRIRAVPGVEHVEATSWMALSAEPSSRNWFATASVDSDRPDVPLSSRLIDGRIPSPDEPDAIVVNEVARDQHGVRIGDRVRIGGLAPEQAAVWLKDPPDTPTVEFDMEVVGVTRGPEDISDTPEPYFIVTEAFYTANHDRVANCVCLVFIRAAPGTDASVAAAVTEIVGPHGMSVTAADPLARRITHAVAVEVNALRIGAVVAAAAGLLLVVLALVRQASEAVEEVRVRRALGLGPRHEAIGAALVALPAVVAGVAVAIAIAVALSALLPQGRARRAEPDPGVWWDIPALMIGALVLIVVGVAAAAGVGWATARRARAMGSQPLRRARQLGGSHLPAPASLGIGFATDPGRDRLRIAAWSGLAGVALAVGAVAAVVTIRSSTDHLLTSPALYGAPYDLAAQGDEELAALAAELPGVEQVALRISLAGSSYALAGPDGLVSVDPEGFRSVRGDLGPQLVAGRRPGAADEALLGPRLARDLEVGIGDEIVVVGTGGAEVGYRVVGLGLDAGVDVIDTPIVLREDGILRLCALSLDPDECEVLPETLHIDVADNADGRAAAALLVEQGAQPVPVPSIVDSLDDVGTVPIVLAALLGILGVVGLVHGLLVALRRRRRDLGIVRALGFTPGQAASTLRWQAAVIALAGGAVGLVLGLVAGRVLWRTLASGVGVVVEVQSPLALLLLPVAAVLVALAAAAVPAARAARLRPADALRSE